MGYASHLKLHRYADIKERIRRLKQQGYTIYAAEITEKSVPLSQITVSEKWVLLVGHEGHGISSDILELCDRVVHIEMEANVKSFNVAVAASIILYNFKHK